MSCKEYSLFKRRFKALAIKSKKIAKSPNFLILLIFYFVWDSISAEAKNQESQGTETSYYDLLSDDDASSGTSDDDDEPTISTKNEKRKLSPLDRSLKKIKEASESHVLLWTMWHKYKEKTRVRNSCFKVHSKWQL